MKCGRCRCEEYIPTHQYVKFSDDVHYVCQACWELFKGWWYRGARAEEGPDYKTQGAPTP